MVLTCVTFEKWDNHVWNVVNWETSEIERRYGVLHDLPNFSDILNQGTGSASGPLTIFSAKMCSLVGTLAQDLTPCVLQKVHASFFAEIDQFTARSKIQCFHICFGTATCFSCAALSPNRPVAKSLPHEVTSTSPDQLHLFRKMKSSIFGMQEEMSMRWGDSKNEIGPHVCHLCPAHRSIR